MGRITIMLIVALLFIDAAFMGNIGSMLGALIDPANMTDLSAIQQGGASTF